MAKKKEEFSLAIELTNASLKLVQREILSNTINLVHIESLDSDLMDEPNYITNALKAILKSYKKVLKTKNVVVSIPSAVSFLRLMELDSEDEEVKEQIEWEIEQQAVGKTSEQLFDWIPIVSDKKEPSLSKKSENSDGVEDSINDVEATEEEIALETVAETEGAINDGMSESAKYLVVATDKERLDAIVSSFKKAKLNPIICDIDIFALINVFSKNYSESKDSNVAVVDLASDKVTIGISKNGEYVDGDVILTPDVDISSADVAKTIEKRLAIISENSGIPISKIMLSGESIADQQLKTEYVGAFTTPCEILEPFKNIGIVDEIALQIGDLSPALAVAVGLSLRTLSEEGSK